MKNILITFLIITLSSCSRYQWVSVESKITLSGNKIHIERIGKETPINDTTVTGRIIIRSKY